MNARVARVAALVLYAAFVCVVTLSPRMPGTGLAAALVNGVLAWLHGRGLLLGVEYSTVEFMANIGMFIPLGVLVFLVKRAWWILLTGPAFSGFIELVQTILLPTRVGEWRDVLSNSLGFFLGVAGALLVRELSQRRTRMVR